MKKISPQAKADALVIDTRPAIDFQNGHLKDSLHLTLKNIPTYLPTLIDKKQPLLFILNDASDVTTLEKAIAEHDLPSIIGYGLFSEFEKEATEKITTIPVADFMHLTTDYQLLDVRTKEEITRLAPTKNLIHIPLGNLKDQLNQLDLQKPIYTLCGSGNRATVASSLLQKNGFSTTVLEGGMKAVEAHRQAQQ